MRHLWPTTTAFVLLALLPACRPKAAPTPSPSPALTIAPHAAPAADPFDAWLATGRPAADGFDPADERALLLVSTAARRMRLRLDGARVGDFEVGFGQQEGRKRTQGDERTPLGTYFVVAKSRGPFDGPYGAYYGGHWIKVNYPNGDDAHWGRREGLLTAEAARNIARDWSRRRPTSQGTPLGGGIGFHGWADDWDLDGPRRLSWGCVVMRNEDIQRVFDRIPLGAMVVIF